MIAISTCCTTYVIGQSPAAGLTSLGAIRAPGFLPDAASTFLFQPNWLYVAGLAAVAVAAFYVARTRADRRARLAAIALTALTLLWVVLSLAVDTSRERLAAAHRGLLDAAERRDVPQIMARLSPDFESTALRITRGPGDHRAAIEKNLAEVLNRYTLRSNRILSMKTSLAGGRTGSVATTTVTVLTDVENFGHVRTTWQLDWHDTSDWLLSEARWIGFGGAAPPGAIP